jgi:Luciferase-like monooxygenase
MDALRRQRAQLRGLQRRPDGGRPGRRRRGGRLVLGVGLGEPSEDEYGSFGEPVDAAVRAAMLDEGLEVLTRLWSGETVSFQGRRAARFDGSTPLKLDPDGELVPLDAGDVRGLLEVVGGYRSSSEPFDAAVGGTTPDDPAAARDVLAPLAEAGVTWWQESVDPRQTDLDAFRRKVRKGPPAG